MANLEDTRLEVEATLGYFPAWLNPALTNPTALFSLWQQTQTAHLNNSLPIQFQQKLYACLSYLEHCNYGTLDCSCVLYRLGMGTTEIWELLQTAIPTLSEMQLLLNELALESEIFSLKESPNGKVYNLIFRCTLFMALANPSRLMNRCQKELRQILGVNQYQELVLSISYCKNWIFWLKSHPEISEKEDLKIQEILPTLLAEERRFFQLLTNPISDLANSQSSLNFDLSGFTFNQYPDQDILERITDAFFAVDHQWVFTYVNSKATQLFQKPVHELVGRNIWEVFPAAIGTTFYHQYHEAIATQIPKYFEEYYQPFDIWVEIRAYPSEQGLSVYYQDITERKKTEAKLQLQAQILAQISDAVIAVDSTNCVTYWNAAAERIYNCSTEQAIGKTLTDLYQYQWLSADVEREAYQSLETLGFWQGENIHIKADGEKIFVESSVSVLKDSLEQKTGYLAVIRDITNRKKIELNLRQSEARFRTAVNNMPDTFVIYDAERRFQFVNNQGLKKSAKSLDEFMGKRDEDFWDESITSGYLPSLLKAIETRSLQSTETSITLPETGTFSVSVKYVPLLDEQGEILQILGFTFETTELRKAEAEIRLFNTQLEQRVHERTAQLETAHHTTQLISNRLTSIIEGSQDLIAAVDRDYRFIVFNTAYQREFQRIFGIQIELGMSLRDALAPLPIEQAKMLAMWNRALAGEQFTIIEAFGDTNCDRRFYEMTFSSIQDNAQNLVGASSIVRDTSERFTVEAEIRRLNAELEKRVQERTAQLEAEILERQHIQEALCENSDRLSLVLDAVELGLWYYDIPLDRLTCNDRCREHFGITLNTPISLNLFYERLHPEDLARTKAAVEQSLQQGNSYDINYRTVSFKGETRWIRAIGKVFFNSMEIPIRFDGITIDITHQKQAEAEYEQLLKREKQAREAAESANRIKDEFLAILSHELRTPLNPILGWSKLLQSHQYDQVTTLRALETIERNAKLQAQLIEDLLDISRILRGQLKLNIGAVNLVKTTEMAIETVWLAAQTKGIKIFTRFDPEVGQIQGDPNRLQQVIWNILSNAVKFTSSGGRIEIEMEKKGEMVEVRVTDTGKGISAHFLPFVFDSFCQENSSLTREFGGLGLGLALVRYLVELHGGTVTAFSPGEGLGATFTVKLPISRVILPESQPEMAIATQVNLESIRILIVDDEIDHLEFLTFLLETCGANVIALESAAKALEIFPIFKPDLLISDIGMPQMDGYVLMQAIRQLPPEQGGNVKAIALTAYAGETDNQKIIQAGYLKHLTKPIEPATLVTAIAILLGINNPGNLQ